MLPNERQPLTLFVLLSLLIHWGLLALLPKLQLDTPQSPEPVTVQLQPTEDNRPRELDMPKLPRKERQTPAKRKAQQDHVAKKETAPQGTTPETRGPQTGDQVQRGGAQQQTPEAQTAPAQPQKQKPVQKQAQTQDQKQQEAVEPQPITSEPAPQVAQEQAQKQPKTQKQPQQTAPATTSPSQQQSKSVPLHKLMADAQQAAIVQADKWQDKYRQEVAKGDTVWLDTEKDLLVSFFQRLRDNVYTVWDYPRRAAERGDQGTSLLKITVNRDGTINNVELKESSGSRLLDTEAVAAVWQGAPYGPLPDSYEKDVLKIFAYFEYRMHGDPRIRGPGN